MDRAFASGASGSAPSAPASPSIGYPAAGNPGSGTPATKPGAYWYHMVTEELRKVITDAGLTPNVSNLTQLSTAIQTRINNSVPAPGSVIYTAKSAAPTGYLKANGAAVPRTTYAELFAAIGTTFGAGDGSTTFNLPDLRGEFVRGFDDGRGVDSGRVFGASQTDAFQGHWHSVVQIASGGSGAVNYISSAVTNTGGSSQQILVGTTVGGPTADGTNGTPRPAAETRPRNIALLACIKF